jgi:hypothetical protein
LTLPVKIGKVIFGKLLFRIGIAGRVLLIGLKAIISLPFLHTPISAGFFLEINAHNSTLTFVLWEPRAHIQEKKNIHVIFYNPVDLPVTNVDSKNSGAR